MKVPLEISVEIGRTKKLVKDILEFTQGSLVSWTNGRRTGRPVCKWTVCCQRRYCSSRDNFGIRITDIVTRISIRRPFNMITDIVSTNRYAACFL